MSSYGALARWYDQLTGDVDYGEFADFYEAEFAADGGEFRLLLDLCCGTGTLTGELTERGYELIGVDASEDMLMQAREKCAELATPPVFICQDAAELDLYGTVDACVCSLDGANYIPPEDLELCFSRLKFFIRPGGMFVFDIKLPEWFRSLDGDVFVDESEDVLCLWRADFDEELGAIVYGMDLFSRRGELWERDGEEHIEYAHEPAWLKSILEENGFESVKLRYDCPQADFGRLFITAKRKDENG